MNPGGGSGWDEPPLDIQIPDDARELDREVLAYHRELRAKRRRNRLRRLAGPFAGRGTVMPLLASILAVCLVAGAMLSVATFSPATAPAEQTPSRRRRSTAVRAASAPARPSAATTALASPSGPVHPGQPSGPARRDHARHRPASRPRPGPPAEPRRRPASASPGQPWPDRSPSSAASSALAAHPEPRVNPRRRDRYDFLPSDGS